MSEPTNSRTLQISLQLAKAEFKMRNEGSIIGIGWYLLTPVLTFGILYLTFANSLGNGIDQYPLYLMLGIVMFNIFQAATLEATKTIIRDHNHLIKSINFPRESLILSIVFRNLFSHLFEIVLLVALFAYYGASILGIFLYLPALLLLLLFTYGSSLLLASFTVYFSDLDNIWAFAARILWFATPIFYVLEKGNSLAQLNLANPLYYLINLGRSLAIGHQLPQTHILLGSICWSVGILALGMLVFSKLKIRMAERI